MKKVTWTKNRRKSIHDSYIKVYFSKFQFATNYLSSSIFSFVLFTCSLLEKKKVTLDESDRFMRRKSQIFILIKKNDTCI